MTALAGFLLGIALAVASAQVCPNGCCKDAHGPHCPAHPHPTRHAARGN